MYYLDRQQGERFHDWAHRVFRRYNRIRRHYVKKHKIDLDRELYFEMYGNSSLYGNQINYNKCLNNARSHLENTHPFMVKIVKNDEYPRSKVLVQQYIEDIKQYKVLKSLNMNFNICYWHIDRKCNFFASDCEHCYNNCCVKCQREDPVRYVPINEKLLAFFPYISYSTIVKCKSTLKQKMCPQCLKIDFLARIIQYYWRQYKNKQQRWQDGVIYEFIDKMINYNINKGALFHALTISKAMDLKTVTKMQSVMNVYK